MDALIVESDEALSLARELADRRGTSVGTAVLDALRDSLAQTATRERPTSRPTRLLPPNEMTPEQRARYDRLQALSRKFAAHRAPGATSDHGDFYGADGLPV